MANGAARIAMWAPLWLLASVAPAHDLAAGGDKACPVSVTAWFTAPGLAHRADLYVVADVDPDFHIYSITQPEGGPNRSRIQLDPSCAYRVVRDFVAVTPPQRTRGLGMCSPACRWKSTAAGSCGTPSLNCREGCSRARRPSRARFGPRSITTSRSIAFRPRRIDSPRAAPAGRGSARPSCGNAGHWRAFCVAKAACRGGSGREHSRVGIAHKCTLLARSATSTSE